jgi:hypothetical protein
MRDKFHIKLQYNWDQVSRFSDAARSSLVGKKNSNGVC